jgi:hypothetical protein
MNLNNDIFLKRLVDQYDAEPPAFVWENISVQLKKNNKRKYLVYLIFSSIIISCFCLLFLINYFNHTNNRFYKNLNSSKTFMNLSLTPYVKEINSGLLSDEIQIARNAKKANFSNNVYFSGVRNINERKSSEGYEIFKDTNISLNTSENLNKKTAEITTRLNQEMYIESKTNKKLNIRFDDGIKCPEFGQSKKLLYAEIGLTGGYHIKTISDGSNQKLASWRKETESSWYSWGAYGAFGVNIKKNFYIGTGLDYTQSKDKFNRSSEEITKMIITFDPASGAPIDTSFVTGKLVNKGEIRYNMIEIPMTFGLVKDYQDWDFGLELSPLYNFSFNSKGKIINDQQIISTIDKEVPVYKKNLGFGAKVSFLIRRNIANGLSIQLKPSFKTYFKNINDTNYSLPMRYYHIYLSAGIRKDF